MKLDDRAVADRLLLECAARGPDPAAVQALLSADIDWPRLVDRAVRHRLAPLLYATLRATSMAEPGNPPDSIMTRLRDLYERHAARHAGRVARLTEIRAALDRAGIPILVLKGAALGNTVYRDPVWRTMGDVDLLIRERDLRAADRVLRDFGYTPDVSWRSEAWYEAHHHHLAPLHAPDGSLIVELHRTIIEVGEVHVPIEELWERADVARIGGVTVRVLAPSDLVLHLCLHLGHDNAFSNGQLRDLRDLAETIRRYDAAVEWDAVVERARVWRVSRYVYWPLWLARDMVGAAVPPEVLARLASVQRTRRADRLLRQLLPEILLRPERWPFTVPQWLMAGALPLLIHMDGSGRMVSGRIRRLRRGIRAARRETVGFRLVSHASGVRRRVQPPAGSALRLDTGRTGPPGRHDPNEGAGGRSVDEEAGTARTG